MGMTGTAAGAITLAIHPLAIQPDWLLGLAVLSVALFSIGRLMKRLGGQFVYCPHCGKSTPKRNKCLACLKPLD